MVLPFHSNLNERPLSYIVFDKHDELLGARIAKDGQWRFPEMDSIPHKFETALLTFEDKDFYSHVGIDFSSLCRAFYQNIKEKRIVSGASTLTMQLMRLHYPDSDRNVMQKVKEILLALKYELHHSKKEIINKYATHAPYGGNVVGLETASWRYYGKTPAKLTWAESCMLAVLPNAPSLIHPGRNRTQLLNKRNRLLSKLLDNNVLDSMEYQLALLEPLADKPPALPSGANHFIEFSKSKTKSMRFESTIDRTFQEQVNAVVENHRQVNVSKGIFNAGIVVMDNKSKNVIAYVGNTRARDHENYNDMVQAPRSTGSILKPLLYASAINDGLILPEQLATDIPISINGFSPKNYNKKCHGAISYSQVISKSLNIPSVTLLKTYGQERFLNELKEYGFTTFNRTSGHYGLPLILGGGDVKLWDLAKVYSGLASVVTTFNAHDAKYTTGEFGNIVCNRREKAKLKEYSFDPAVISAGSAWSALKAMEMLERPNADGNWEKFQSSKKIHWKTGTSFGNKDAWAVGVTPQYTVAVWMGNSSGEGRPDVIGVSAAGSVLFDVFNLLTITEEFEAPLDDLVYKSICMQSGHVAGEHCTNYIDRLVPQVDYQKAICPYHQPVLLNPENGKRVYQACAEGSTVDTSWFVLSPTMAYHYKRFNPSYASLPEFDDACSDHQQGDHQMEFVYPKEDSDLFIPVDLHGEKEQCVFKANHKDMSSTIFWHLNNRYIGKTNDFHELSVELETGEYVLSIQDETGLTLSHTIRVL